MNICVSKHVSEISRDASHSSTFSPLVRGGQAPDSTITGSDLQRAPGPCLLYAAKEEPAPLIPIGNNVG